MKRFTRIFSLLVVFVLMLAQTALAEADFSRLIILHTNDTHGFDRRDEGINGMATVAQVKKDLLAQGYEVLLFDSGDAIQDNNLVNFFKGKSAVDFMNAAGYDAASLGNHEFDYGQDVLAERIAQAKFPYLSANVVVDATGKLLAPKPSAIFELESGAKVGVIGLTTPETIVSTAPKNTLGLTFIGGEKLYETTQSEVDRLKGEGCELIIVIGHLGSSDACIGDRAEDIAANVEGIDIVLDGHDHRVKNFRVGNTLIAETGFYTKNIGRVVFENGEWVSKPIAYGEVTQEDPATKEIIESYYTEMKEKLSQKLGVSKVMLTGEREPGVRTMETNSGDFCADALLWQAKRASVLDGDVDAAIDNGGSIRKAINVGEVTRGDVMGVHPYNNQLFAVKITGEKLLEILEAATCVIPDAMGAFPQVAGITFELDTKVAYEKGEQYTNSVFFAPKKPGSRVTIKTVGGKPFDKNKVYTLAMAEFLVTGGDAYGGMATEGAIIEKRGIGYVDFEALENYLVEELGGVIGEEYAAPQGRIVIK